VQLPNFGEIFFYIFGTIDANLFLDAHLPSISHNVPQVLHW
jgi:hypothetical protein